MAQNNGTIGFEDKSWKDADKLRNNMDVGKQLNIKIKKNRKCRF